MPDPVTEALQKLPALAIRAQAIANAYSDARADRNAAAADLVASVIALVQPYLPAITGQRPEIGRRGVDLFPGALILCDDGSLWERASDGWHQVGSDAVRSTEVAEFLEALVDMFGRVVEGKAQRKTGEEQAIAKRFRALTAMADLLR